MNANAAARRVLQAVTTLDTGEYRLWRRELAQFPYREQRLAIWRHGAEILSRFSERTDEIDDASRDSDTWDAERDRFVMKLVNFLIEADEEFALAVMLESTAGAVRQDSLNAIAAIGQLAPLDERTDDGIVLVGDLMAVSALMYGAGTLCDGGELAVLADLDAARVSDAEVEALVKREVEAIRHPNYGALPERSVSVSEMDAWVNAVTRVVEVSDAARESYTSALRAAVEGMAPAAALPEHEEHDGGRLRFAVVCHAFVTMLRGEWPPILTSSVDDVRAVEAECLTSTAQALQSGDLPLGFDDLMSLSAMGLSMKKVTTRAVEQVRSFGGTTDASDT